MIQEEPKKITNEELNDLKKLIEAIDPDNKIFDTTKEIMKEKTKTKLDDSTKPNEIDR